MESVNKRTSLKKSSDVNNNKAINNNDLKNSEKNQQEKIIDKYTNFHKDQNQEDISEKQSQKKKVSKYKVEEEKYLKKSKDKNKDKKKEEAEKQNKNGENRNEKLKVEEHNKSEEKKETNENKENKQDIKNGENKGNKKNTENKQDIKNGENKGNKEIKKNKENNKKKREELRKEYEDKSKEISQKEEELNRRKENIKIKDIKFNTLPKQLSKDKKEFEKEKQDFYNKIKEREKHLKEREEKLLEKERKFKRIREFNIPPNSPPILIGLNNIGATCYMNASLQCLSNTKKLTEYFLYKYKSDKNKIMTYEYYKLLRKLWKKDSNNKPYSPNSFKEVLSKENPLFAGVAANDSKDLINFLLERFHQDLNDLNVNNENNIENIGNLNHSNEMEMLGFFLNDYKNKYNSPISNLFYGILETNSQCNICKLVKYNFQVYSFLEFPLQPVNQFCFNQGKRPLFTNEGKNPDVDLYECFDYYRKIDIMNGENQMYCNNCKKQTDSLFMNLLYSGPNNLIIHLNRGKGAVYECKVIFPEQLNIYNYVTFKDGATFYELYAVVCHLGPSSMSGHFVAYCKNRIDKKWYLYNDAIVTLCTRPQQYYDGMPYILFYKAIIKSN